MVVAGASGFAGALAASLVHRHPSLELAAATARTDAGTRLDRLYPRYRVPIELTELDTERAGGYEAAIVAYPHGAAAEVVARFVEAGVPVVDVSADFRLHNPAVYEETYGDHAAPELLADAVYGLPELHRDEVRAPGSSPIRAATRPQRSSRSHLSPRRGSRTTWSSAPPRGSPAPGGSRETVSTSSRWTRTSRRTESRATATYRRSSRSSMAPGGLRSYRTWCHWIRA